MEDSSDEKIKIVEMKKSSIVKWKHPKCKNTAVTSESPSTKISNIKCSCRQNQKVF